MLEIAWRDQSFRRIRLTRRNPEAGQVEVRAAEEAERAEVLEPRRAAECTCQSRMGKSLPTTTGHYIHA
jgi:hypothetical protein